MKLAADLHIHSCVSPCGDMDMTPNNIVNMSLLKGLEAIAVCDHNSARNLAACEKVASAAGLLLLPGIEAESREEVHVLCYFPTVEAAEAMGEILYDHLPEVWNVPKFFGAQIVMNEEDEPVDTVDKLLVQSTTLSIDQIVAHCRRLGGVPVPAHINRPANSLLACLGFVPEQLGFCSMEVYTHLAAPRLDLSRYHVLHSSDAHRLDAILERQQFVTALGPGPEGILSYLAYQKTY